MERKLIVFFEEMLHFNWKEVELFFERIMHKELDVPFLSQSYFDLPEKTIGNICNIIISITQNLTVVVNIHRHFAGFYMKNDECGDLCRETWQDEDFR